MSDPFMGESFWQNSSLVTYTLFELHPIIIFILVANSGDQSLYYNGSNKSTGKEAGKMHLCAALNNKFQLNFASCIKHHNRATCSNLHP